MTARTDTRRTVETPIWLSPEQVCELLPGMTTEVLQQLRKKRLDPPYYKPTGDRGKVILYRHSDIVAWVERHAVQTRGAA